MKGVKKKKKKKVIDLGNVVVMKKEKGVRVVYYGAMVSSNHQYSYNRYTKRMFLLPEAKQAKQEIAFKIKQDVDPKFFENKELKVIINVFRRWYTLEGKVRKVDIQNQAKLLVDAVFDGIGVDDKNVFEIVMVKRDIKNEDERKVIIDVEEVAKDVS